MTNSEDQIDVSVAKKLRGIRANSLAASVMLLIELGLGVSVNLYAKLPASDHGKSMFVAFGRAVTSGPISLTLHALLGTLLLLSAITLVVRTWSIRQTLLLVLAIVGLVAILMAWFSGARFVGTMANGASMAMGLATVVAILCYVLILFVTPADSRGKMEMDDG
jgi:hypothetical protein